MADDGITTYDPSIYQVILPECSGKGDTPRCTIRNLAFICERLGVTVRYNVISKSREIIFPGRGLATDDHENVALNWLVSECDSFHMPTHKVAEFVGCLANNNIYNPVATWIESKPWDGTDHFANLLETVIAKNERTDPAVKSMKDVFLRKWMLSAVASAYRPNGTSSHGVLVFQGAQYVGKTKWFKSLVPGDMGLLKDGMLIRPDSRDSVMQCIQYWLVELGELDATFRRADIAHLKAFITNSHDTLRRPYARMDVRYPRRTVFFASVNQQNFLHDDTGNRRFWTIAIDELIYDHKVNMQQCWAQIAAAYHTAEASAETAERCWYLNGEEFKTLTVHNQDFEASDNIADIVDTILDWDCKSGWRWTTATEILMKAGIKNPSRSDVSRAGRIIRDRNDGKARRGSGGSRLLWAPPFTGSAGYQQEM